MLVACYIVYEDKLQLSRSLLSVRNAVDRVIVVDGAWQGFPDGTPFSTDGTKELVKDFAAGVRISAEEDSRFKRCTVEFVECPELWKSEAEKRNVYLRMLEEGDYALIIDADETLEGNLQREVEVMQQAKRLVGRVMITDVNAPSEYFFIPAYTFRQPRLLHYMEGMEYINVIRNNNLELNLLIDERKPRLTHYYYCNDIRLVHFESQRPDERRAKMRKFLRLDF